MASLSLLFLFFSMGAHINKEKTRKRKEDEVLL
jgi:hypothetical protein